MEECEHGTAVMEESVKVAEQLWKRVKSETAVVEECEK